MQKFIKHHAKLPIFYVGIILFIVFAIETQEALRNANDIYIGIVSINESSINAGNKHSQIYMLLILLNFVSQFDFNDTLRIFRYKNKGTYYRENILKNIYIQILLFIIILVLFIDGLLLINGAFIFNFKFIVHTIIGIGSLVLFYTSFVSILLLLINLNINKYIALVIVFIFSFYCSFLQNILGNSLAMLKGNLFIYSNIFWSIIVFYLAFNILMAQLNIFLFNRKDIR